MNLTSEKITGVLSALEKARNTFRPVTKDKINPFFKSNYADLSSILVAVEESLNKNGIQIVQHTKAEQGTALLVTMLYHVPTGEYLGGEYPLVMKEQTPQAMGSALTYARRYALVALLSLNQEDDDGNAASVKPASKVAQFDKDYEEQTQEDHSQTKECPLEAHKGMIMKQYQSKKTGHWFFSHKLADDTWCNGVSKKNG